MQNMGTQQTPVSFSHSGTQETKLVLGEAQNSNLRDSNSQGQENSGKRTVLCTSVISEDLQGDRI